MTKRPSVLPASVTRNECRTRPSKPSDPLIAVCAGGTTRGVPLLEEQSLALFRFLLPSLGRTADCGFNYAAFIGYDVGDKFFDTDSGRAKVSVERLRVGEGGRGHEGERHFERKK